jgi:hypothetical protein
VSTTTEKAIKNTLHNSYKVAVKSVHPRGTWGHSEISVFYAKGGLFNRRLGGYTRNYPGHGLGTWYPFSHGGKDYALYSRDYTSTRIMELPSCRDIGGEEPAAWGFCPVEYCIPEIVYFEKQPIPEKPDSFHYHIKKAPSEVAFVAGCIFGDDSSWKIQCFDLSQVESGFITRDERFGYVAMPKGVSLQDAVSLKRSEETGTVIATLAIMQTFELASGNQVTVDPFA